MTQGQKTLASFIINHPDNDKLLGIVKDNNKSIERRLLQSIKELPKLEVKATTMHDWAFTEPISELTEKQKDKIKKLISNDNN